MFIIFSQLNPPFSGSYRIVKMPVSIYRVIFYRFNNLFVLRLPLHSNSTVYFIHRTQYLLQNLASFVKFFDNFGVLFTSQFFVFITYTTWRNSRKVGDNAKLLRVLRCCLVSVLSCFDSVLKTQFGL